MTTKEAFEHKNRIGRMGQELVIRLLLEAGWKVQSSDQDGCRDITVDNRQGETLRIEIKNESKNWFTGNIALEMFDAKGLSAFAKTTADVWIHLLKDRFALYRVPEMKEWLHAEKGRYGVKYGPFGGETDNGCGGYLIPIRFLVLYPWSEIIPLAELSMSRVLKRPEPRKTPTMNNKHNGQNELFQNDELPPGRLEWL